MSLPDNILVIGSGIGGMTAAIALAKLGCRVTVIEKNKITGGLMRSYTRWGIECDVGVHYIGAMDDGQPLRRIFDFLGITSRIPLVRMGEGGVVDQYHFPDMTFDFPSGIDAFENNLFFAFPKEAAQIAKVMAVIRIAAARLTSLAAMANQQEDFDIVSEFRPVGAYLMDIGCSPGLCAVLLVPLGWIGMLPEECPLYMWSSAVSSYLLSSWRLANGGRQLADTLAARVKELGGIIIEGDEVRKILVQDRTVRGIVLASGRELSSSALIAAIHPKTLLRLLPEDSVKPSYRNRILSLKETPGVFCTHIAVPAADNPPKPYNLFAFHSADIGEGMFLQLKKSMKPGWNVLSIIERSPFEKWQQWKDTSTGHRGQEYEDAKDREVSILLDRAREFLGPLSGAHTVDSFTPLTLRDWVNSPDGGAYGVLRSTDQKFKTAALHRTPISGLHLVGQSTFAPGILGTALGTLRTISQLIGDESLLRRLLDSHEENIYNS